MEVLVGQLYDSLVLLERVDHQVLVYPGVLLQPGQLLGHVPVLPLLQFQC